MVSISRRLLRAPSSEWVSAEIFWPELLPVRLSLLVQVSSRVLPSSPVRRVSWLVVLRVVRVSASAARVGVARVWMLRARAWVGLAVELREWAQRSLEARVGRSLPWIGVGSGEPRGAFLLRGRACRSRFRIDGRLAG